MEVLFGRWVQESGFCLGVMRKCREILFGRWVQESGLRILFLSIPFILFLFGRWVQESGRILFLSIPFVLFLSMA